MCEQTEVTYLEGDIVWVKLGACWWPGKVRDINNLDEEILESFRKPPIAAVQFFEEDKFEFIKSLEQICRYNCRRKNEFIKKGLDMYRTKQREGSSFMDKFPIDVAVAEKLTGGDPKILNDDIFAPEEKPNYRNIFGADKKSLDKKTPDKKNKLPSSSSPWHGKVSPGNVRRAQASLTLPTHLITQRVIKNLPKGDENEESDNHVRIRHQPTNRFQKDPEPKEPYQCYLCDYRTTRLNVYVLHHKRHSAEDSTINAHKKSGTPKSVTPVSNKRGRPRSLPSSGVDSSKSHPEIPSKTSETPRSSTASQHRSKAKAVSDSAEDTAVKDKSQVNEKKSPKTPIFGKKRSLKSGGEKGVKKKKNSEDFKEKLLADWGDVDPEAEEKEIEILKKALSESQTSKPSTSCFDFDEKADSILDSKHEERAKKFAETRKIPRFPEEKRDLKIDGDKGKVNDTGGVSVEISTKDSSDEKDKSLCDAFDSVMAETELPSLPLIPDLPAVAQCSEMSSFLKQPSHLDTSSNGKLHSPSETSDNNEVHSDNNEIHSDADDCDDIENQNKSEISDMHENSNLAVTSDCKKPLSHIAALDHAEISFKSQRSADIIQFANFSNYSDATNHENDHSHAEIPPQHKLPESVSHVADSASDNDDPMSEEYSHATKSGSRQKLVGMSKQPPYSGDTNHHEVLSLSEDSNSQKPSENNETHGQCDMIHLSENSELHKFHVHSSSVPDQGVSEHSNQDSTKPPCRREVPGLIEISRRQDNQNITDSSSFPVGAKFIDTVACDGKIVNNETGTYQKDSDDESSLNHPKEIDDEEEEEDEPNDDSLEHNKSLDDYDDDDDTHDNHKNGSNSDFHKDDDDHVTSYQKNLDEDSESNHRNTTDTTGHTRAVNASDVEEEELQIDDKEEEEEEEVGFKVLNTENTPDHLTGQNHIQTSHFDETKDTDESENHSKFSDISHIMKMEDCSEKLSSSETSKSEEIIVSNHDDENQDRSSVDISGSMYHRKENLFHGDTCSTDSHSYSKGGNDVLKIDESENMDDINGPSGPNVQDFAETAHSKEENVHVSSKCLHQEHHVNTPSSEKNLEDDDDDDDDEELSHSQSLKDIGTPIHSKDILVQDETTEDSVLDKSPAHQGALDLSESSTDTKYIDFVENDRKDREFSGEANLHDDVYPKDLNTASSPNDSEQLEHNQTTLSLNLDESHSHNKGNKSKNVENLEMSDYTELNHEVVPCQGDQVKLSPPESAPKEKDLSIDVPSPVSERIENKPLIVESTLSSDTDHDYSTKHSEMHRMEIVQDPQERQESLSEIDDEMELDINSMPVVMDDTVITDDTSIKVMNDNTLPVPIPIISGDALQVAASQPVETTKIVTTPPKSPIVKVIKPAIKTVKLHTGASTSSGCNLKTSEGATIVSTKGAMSGYVVIQPSQSGQPSFYSAGKPLQQCLTLKSVPQQQVGKKVMIVKSPQGSVQQEILSSGGKVTIPQRIVKSQGTVLKQVSGKAVMGRGTRLVPLTQQQVKALTASGKQSFGSKLTMQSSQTKVVLPTMQSIKKITVPQSPVKMIATSSAKQKGNTILIQTTQSSVVSSSTALPISQTLVRQNVPRPKVIATPSSGSSIQRVLASQASGQSQAKVLATQPTLQPRMVVHKVRSPSIGKASNTSQLKRLSGIFPRSQVIQKNITKTPSIHKIIPIQPQTKDDTQTSKVSLESSTQSSDVLSTRHLPVFQPVQPEITISPTISQGFQSSNSTVLSTSQNTTTTTSVSTMPVVSTSATSLLIPEQIAQVMASTTNDPSATYVLVSIEEPNSLQSYENPTLLYDGSSQSSSNNTRTLIIDPTALSSYNNQDNIILAIPSHSGGSGTIMNLSQANTGETRTTTTGTSSVFRARGNASSGSATSNQDILAAALANTDVFQPEVSLQDSLTVVNNSQSANGSVMTSRLLESSPPLIVSSSAPLLLPSLTSVLPPTNTAGVLETSLTLSQPIMTPLEVPSSVTNLQNPPPAVPTSLELPLTITQPLNIPTQSSFNTLSLASSDLPVSNSQSIGKTFHPSMPLLSEEVTDSSESSVVLTSPGSATLSRREVLPKLSSPFMSGSSQAADGDTKLGKDPTVQTEIQSFAQVPEISSRALEEGLVPKDVSPLRQSTLSKSSTVPHAEEPQSSPERDLQNSLEVSEHSEQAVSTSYTHSTNGVAPKAGLGAVDSSSKELSSGTESSEAIALRDSSSGELEGSLSYNPVESTSCAESTECSSTSSHAAETSSHVTTSQLHDMLTFSDSSTDGSTPASHSMPLLSDETPDHAGVMKRNIEEEMSENEESHLPIKRRKLVDER